MQAERSPGATVETTGTRFLFVWLSPGISQVNAWALMWGALTTIGLLTFVAVATPLVLTVNLGVPESEQGTITGDLVFWTEVTQILIFGLVGVLADRIGRRQMYALGLLGMGAAYALYPFADSIGELTLYRVLYAVGLGASTGMLGTIVADYPQEVSRGKMVALVGVLNGLGVILVTALLGSLPERLVAAGFGEISAARYTHAVALAGCVITAVVLALGLKKGTPGKREERPPVLDLIRSGVAEARNLRIALAYAAAFVARGDLVIVGTFVILWGKTAAIAQGFDPSEAIGKGTLVFVTVSTAALIWLFILGAFMDRLNRVSGLILCMALATIGYLTMMLVDNPLDPAARPLFLVLGVGQISAFFGATTLIGAEAPRLKRGAVVGMFNIFGAIGILVASSIGGRLFDAIAPNAPFVLIGVLNGCVMLFAIYVRIKAPGAMPHRLRS